jgi:hypothetical protein
MKSRLCLKLVFQSNLEFKPFSFMGSMVVAAGSSIFMLEIANPCN